MTTRRLRRLFWRGAATLLVIAALVALAAVLGGDFDETDGEILATLGVVLLAGGVALAGLGLREQGKAAPVSFAILVAAPVPAFAWLVWGEVAALAVAVAITLVLIWADNSGDGSAKLAVACWILAILGWVLVPVLQRSAAPTAASRVGERVLATLADVDLVITSDPQQDDLVVRGASQLYPGEHMALRLRRS